MRSDGPKRNLIASVLVLGLCAIAGAAEKSADMTLDVKDAKIVARPEAGGETATFEVHVKVTNTGSTRIILTPESLIYELRKKGEDEPLPHFSLRDPRRVKAKPRPSVIAPGKTATMPAELSIHTVTLDKGAEYELTVKGQVFDAKATQKIKFK